MKELEALVIDDEVDMCWALERILQAEGIKTHSAYTAAEALKMFEKRKPPKLAFIDVRLPDMDGIELARLIKVRQPRLPIILISGYYYKDDPAIKTGIGDVFMDFIEKPFDVKEIQQIVHKALLSIEEIP